MYGGEGSYGGYYGMDDAGSAENSGYPWYPATESVASGSTSLSIPPSGFPSYPPTSAFPTAGPGTGWFPTQAAPSRLPYYSPPAPVPNIWGDAAFPPTAFTHPAGYDRPEHAPYGYTAEPSPQYSHPNPYIAPPPSVDDWFSRASTPFNAGTPSTGSWESWPSMSSSGSSRFFSHEPGDTNEAFGLSALDPADARRFVENRGELRFAEDTPGREFTPLVFTRISAPSVDAAPSISQRKRKRTSKKQTPADLGADLGRLEDLDWQPSDTVWLDEGVSSEYVEFPHGLKLTSQKPIFRLERVTGVPSELPHFEIATAFILSIPKDVFPKNMTPDNVFRNMCPHSYESSTGSRSAVDTRLSGFWFGRDPGELIDTRRATPKCRGVRLVGRWTLS
ncbi:hypothetical protein C8R46DRAFT_1024961 [Mycena filopes]|nr:hypothetical protein C8R46DRAFT_1024961 [Mycena filopes]